MNLYNENHGFPVEDIIPEVRSQLSDNNTLIITAPPGAGKSTILPLALADEPWLEGQKIIMLEPRRLAARSIASRMSELTDQPVGKSIGYRVRFENKVSASTRIEVVTEGILTRMLQSDNTLEGVGMVIFDEFHERSLFADVALALCREVQQVLRPELRIVIMSATLDVPKLSQMLDAPVLESPGRMFPVDVIYDDRPDEKPIAERTAASVIRAAARESGDMLVFLPGEAEIRACGEILDARMDDGFVVHPLYGQLPFDKQRSAIMPDPSGKRKIVLATSIAETSLTIEGVRVVIDCGYCRTQRFNPVSEMSRLETVMISKDMADQRAGRAGRLEPGVCYRLWSRATWERMSDHRTAEIEEADLAPLVLDLAVWGVQDAGSMCWLTPPPQASLHKARMLLEELGAIDSGRITSYGRDINRLPCHPRIAHMLKRAEVINAGALAADVAAIIEERDPLPKGYGVDINLRIEALRKYRSRSGGTQSMARIESAAASYRRMLGVDADNSPVDVYLTGLLLAHAYPGRVARSLDHGQFQLAAGVRARIDQSDDVAHEQWITVAHLDTRDGMGRIFLASPLRIDDLLPYAIERDVVSWESRNGGLVARREMRFGRMMIKSRPLQKVDKELVREAICEAVESEGENLLNFNEDVVQWQNRVLSLRKWQPGQEWPDVSTPSLLAACREWLMPYLDNVTRVDDLKRIDLCEVLQFNLAYELQQQIDHLAPQRIEVPSGSKIRLTYFSDGAQPILAVRLQECFGLAATPRLCDGRIGVLMHLLSPGFKPVQITSDLSSFWNNAYFDVKKELKSRYPRHVWPDDPWTEQAIRGTKRKV